MPARAGCLRGAGVRCFAFSHDSSDHAAGMKHPHFEHSAGVDKPLRRALEAFTDDLGVTHGQLFAVGPMARESL
jgi:hypothetical protein